MKKDKLIYWISTGIFGAMMLMSGIMYFASPEVTDGFRQLGFPDFFRQELGAAKIIGAIVLLVPQVPLRVKEWAYAGFGITLISATIAHIVHGDPAQKFSAPVIFLLVMILSYHRLLRIRTAVNHAG